MENKTPPPTPIPPHPCPPFEYDPFSCLLHLQFWLCFQRLVMDGWERKGKCKRTLATWLCVGSFKISKLLSNSIRNLVRLVANIKWIYKVCFYKKNLFGSISIPRERKSLQSVIPNNLFVSTPFIRVLL